MLGRKDMERTMTFQEGRKIYTRAQFSRDCLAWLKCRMWIFEDFGGGESEVEYEVGKGCVTKGDCVPWQNGTFHFLSKMKHEMVLNIFKGHTW